MHSLSTCTHREHCDLKLERGQSLENWVALHKYLGILWIRYKDYKTYSKTFTFAKAGKFSSQSLELVAFLDPTSLYVVMGRQIRITVVLTLLQQAARISYFWQHVGNVTRNNCFFVQWPKHTFTTSFSKKKAIEI